MGALFGRFAQSPIHSGAIVSYCLSQISLPNQLICDYGLALTFHPPRAHAL
jgi:hypothetical protein